MAAPDEVPAPPAGTPPPLAAPRTAVFVVDGPITHEDIPLLCERLRALMDPADVDTIVCDLRGLMAPDGATIDALARLQLAARRRGCRVALRNPSTDLLGLIVLAGLSETVPLEPGSLPDGAGPTRPRGRAPGAEDADGRR